METDDPPNLKMTMYTTWVSLQVLRELDRGQESPGEVVEPQIPLSRVQIQADLDEAPPSACLTFSQGKLALLIRIPHAANF